MGCVDPPCSNEQQLYSANTWKLAIASAATILLLIGVALIAIMFVYRRRMRNKCRTGGTHKLTNMSLVSTTSAHLYDDGGDLSNSLKDFANGGRDNNAFNNIVSIISTGIGDSRLSVSTTQRASSMQRMSNESAGDGQQLRYDLDNASSFAESDADVTSYYKYYRNQGNGAGRTAVSDYFIW
jgi:hypothetical protein